MSKKFGESSFAGSEHNKDGIFPLEGNGKYGGEGEYEMRNGIIESVTLYDVTIRPNDTVTLEIQRYTTNTIYEPAITTITIESFSEENETISTDVGSYYKKTVMIHGKNEKGEKESISAYYVSSVST